MFDWVGDLIDGIVDGFLTQLKEWFCWLVNLAMSWGVPWIESAIAGVEGVNVDVSALVFWVGVINAWVPVTEGVAAVGIYMSLWAVMVVVRWIIKLIPTIG